MHVYIVFYECVLPLRCYVLRQVVLNLFLKKAFYECKLKSSIHLLNKAMLEQVAIRAMFHVFTALIMRFHTWAVFENEMIGNNNPR